MKNGNIKRKFKVLIFALLVSVAVTLSWVSAFAESGDAWEISKDFLTENEAFEKENGLSIAEIAEFPPLGGESEQKGEESFNQETDAPKEEEPSKETNAEAVTDGVEMTDGKNADKVEEITAENLFTALYNLVMENSDKIFSVLAFIGTLIVGVGYKSGLLPLLRDAFSRLKSALDSAKEESDKNELYARERMEKIGQSIKSIDDGLKKNGEELSRIEWQFESYEEMMKERKMMTSLLSAQVDMLYAIFMSSGLPQYQKDEIGEKIQKMRQEIKSYE